MKCYSTYRPIVDEFNKYVEKIEKLVDSGELEEDILIAIADCQSISEIDAILDSYS